MRNGFLPARVGFLLIVLLGWLAPAGLAETLAYWRFEDHPVGQKLEAELGTTSPPFTTTADSSGHGNDLRTWNTRKALHPPDTSGTFVPVEQLPRLAGEMPNTRAVRFVGEQDFYTIGDPKNPVPIESAELRQFTVEGFFRLDTLSQRIREKYQVIVSKDGRPVPRVPNQPFAVVVAGRNDGQLFRDCLSVNIIDRAGRYRYAASRKPLKTDTWYAFAAVCDGSTLKLYLNRFDGEGYQLEAETPVEGGLFPSTDQWVIGRGAYNNQPNSWLYGYVDEIRISDEALESSAWLAAGIDTLPQPPARPAADIPPPPMVVPGMADPTVLLHEGVYYLYGTTDTISFTVWMSRDLRTWEKGPKVLSRGEGVWGDHQFWAPGVIAHKGKIYLFYSANGVLPGTGGRRSVRISVAVADSPLGPFKEVVPRMPLLGRSVIDPEPFIDEDGQAYLYFVADIPENNGSGQIYVVRLSDDLLSPVGEPLMCIEPSQPWEGHIWNEGPFVFREGDTYVMMYSGEFWASHNYSVGVATAPTPFGPWDKRDDNPFLHRFGGLMGTGHNSMAPAPDGRGWITFFHAHPNPRRTQPRNTHIARVVVERDVRGDVKLRAEPFMPDELQTPTTRPADAPAVSTPAVSTPAVSTPAVGKPAVGKPAVGKPAVGTPAVGKPAVGKSAASERADTPAAGEVETPAAAGVGAGEEALEP